MNVSKDTNSTSSMNNILDTSSLYNNDNDCKQDLCKWFVKVQFLSMKKPAREIFTFARLYSQLCLNCEYVIHQSLTKALDAKAKVL